MDMYYEASRFANHLCQIIWSLSFAGRLGAGTMAEELRALLLTTGQKLDRQWRLYQGSIETRTVSMALPPTSAGRVAVKEPELALKLRGISVVLKPPNWEVDAKGQLSSSGLYLSHFMQRESLPDISPVLLLPDFEYGFVHRLDVPSSGLVLTGTHFEGYALLQWQMHTYAIER